MKLHFKMLNKTYYIAALTFARNRMEFALYELCQINFASFYAKVDGGDGETYYWSVDNEEMARVDPIEGFVTVHNGPGEFKVRAAMPDSHHNYGEVKVY